MAGNLKDGYRPISGKRPKRMGATMDTREQYRVTYTTHEGWQDTITIRTRFLPTDIAVLVKCGATNIKWTHIK
jgi:hypothetical protein